MQWALIRADANNDIGLGHIMRCLTLADEFAKQDIKSIFICRHAPTFLKNKIIAKGHEVIILSNENVPPPSEAQGIYGSWLGTTIEHDIKQTINAITKKIKEYGNPAYILVDHYALDESWEKSIKNALGAKTIVIDDLSERKHDCDYLIDTTFGKTAKDYYGLVPKSCKLMVGAEFALLREEFPKLRNSTLKARDKDYANKAKVKNLLISVGGVDKDNVTMMMLKIINQLDETPKFLTHIIIGATYPYLQELKTLIGTLPFEVKIHQDVTNIAELYALADICIGAAGSSSWERCCLGLPTINIVIADNQKTIAQKLSQKKAILNAGCYDEITTHDFIKNYLNPALNNSNIRHELSMNSRDICDGKGVQKIYNNLLSITKKNNKKITLRQATANDIKLVFDWQCLPETRKYSNNRTIPKWEEHQKWMKQKLNNSDVFFYIICYDNENVGVVRIEKNEDKNYLLSIFIAPEFFQQGIASAALKLISEKHKSFTIIAQVKNENTNSINLFLRNGYEKYKKEWYKLKARCKNKGIKYE